MTALVRRLVFLSALALLAIAGTNGASAAGHVVSIVGTPQTSSFTPASLTISLNDTVTWMNDSPTIHYVVFSGASPVAVQNNTPYTKTFTTAGTFSYYCSKHPSMTGTVVVLGPPPTPAPTAPPTTAPTVAPTPAPTVAPMPAPTIAPPPPPPSTVAPMPVFTPAPLIPTATPAPAPAVVPTPVPTEEPVPTDEPALIAVAEVTPTNTPEPTVEALAVAPLERAASILPLDPANEPLAVAPGNGTWSVVWWSALTAASALAIGLLFWLFLFGPLRVRRYWFEFDVESSTATSALSERLAGGCGVTGRDEDDCLQLVKRDVLAGNELPRVRRVVRDVDPSTLSATIQPTMNWPRVRGVWYPST